MSAWYIFSSLGFYPVTPGSNQYAIGSPIIEEAIINLENGKTLTIKVKNQSKDNIYVNKITIDDEIINKLFFTHEEIINGKEIIFEMTNSPNN